METEVTIHNKWFINIFQYMLYSVTFHDMFHVLSLISNCCAKRQWLGYINVASLSIPQRHMSF